MVKEFKLVLDSTDHSPGSTVQGKLVVGVDKPKSYHSIVVSFKGKAKVHWSESSGSGDNQTTTHYTNSEVYFDVMVAVWKAEDSPTGDLPVGPFSFQIPQGVPSSFESPVGQVRYKVEARVVQGGAIHTLVKGKHAIKARINVRDTSAAEMMRRYSEPVTVERTKRLKFLWFNKGSISARVNIPRTAFSPGKEIPVSAYVNNQSSRQIHTVAYLHRIDTFISSGGKHNVLTTKVARTPGGPVMQGLILSQDMNLNIPTEAQTTMHNCSCIKVENVLIVEVVIPWSFNKKIKIPVLIANGDPASVAGPAVPFNLQPQEALGYHTSQGPSLTEPRKWEVDSYLPSYGETIGNTFVSS